MTWVKICGLTNLEDARTAVDAGADAVGFVFYEKSPRSIHVDAARAIVEKLPERVEKVGVFVGDDIDATDEIRRQVGLTAVQVYSRSIEQWFSWRSANQCKLMVAVPGSAITGDYLAMLAPADNKLHALVIDSGSGERPGGTGQTFDWKSVKENIRRCGMEVPVVVAGGLTSQNVSEAIQILRPWGVDVASGVEAKPGKKDPEKVRAFVTAVRESDRR